MFHEAVDCLDTPLLVDCLPSPFPFPLLLPLTRESTPIGSSPEPALDNTFTRDRFHDPASARLEERVDLNSHFIVSLESSRIQLQVAFQTLRNHRLSCTAFDRQQVPRLRLWRCSRRTEQPILPMSAGLNQDPPSPEQV